MPYYGSRTGTASRRMKGIRVNPLPTIVPCLDSGKLTPRYTEGMASTHHHMLLDEPISVERLGPSEGAELAHALEDLVPEEERERALPSPRYLGDLLAAPTTYVFLARCGQFPVGYLSAYRFPRLDYAGDHVYLFDIEVAPAARRSGIGRRLVQRLLDACRADAVTLVWAGTALDNVAAQRTFEAAGGRRVSETYVEYEFRLAEL